MRGKNDVKRLLNMSIKFYTSQAPPKILHPPKQISGYAPGDEHKEVEN